MSLIYHNLGKIYPDLPAIAKKFKIDVNQIVSYQEWYSVFIFKIEIAANKFIFRFVSYSFIRKVVNVAKGFGKKLVKCKSQADKNKVNVSTSKYFRVVRSLDKGKSPRWHGDYAISVLVQEIFGNGKPFWIAMLKSKGVEKDNILVKDERNQFILTDIDYLSYLGFG